MNLSLNLMVNLMAILLTSLKIRQLFHKIHKKTLRLAAFLLNFKIINVCVQKEREEDVF